MSLPTEPIGSVPRSAELLGVMRSHGAGEIGDTELAAAQDQAVRDTIHRLQRLGSPVVTDGEQTKPSFATYPIAGLEHLAPDGVIIPFADGHQRQLPRLTAGPSTAREIAFAKIAARVDGTALASQRLGI